MNRLVSSVSIFFVLGAFGASLAACGSAADASETLADETLADAGQGLPDAGQTYADAGQKPPDAGQKPPDAGSSSTADAGSSTAKDAGPDSLVFPKNNFTVKSATVTTSSGSKTVSYRFYNHLAYVSKPVDLKYQSLDVSVPVSIDGVAVDASNAPIFFNINVAGYNSSENKVTTTGSGAKGNSGLALAAGYVVVSPGCRGRDNVTSDGVYYGKAPAAIVDLKAAVRYIRHNSGVLPGNVERIISSGGSAGGALSALLGASGNSTLYDSYLTAIGAAEAGDSIYASIAYSPITNLDHVDVCYEWEYGDVGTVNQTISGELKAAFPAYQNGLALSGRNGYGTLTDSNINDYILTNYLIPSAEKYLSALSSSDLTSYLAGHTWITWNNSKASFTFADYVKYIGRAKKPPAGDSFFDSTAYSGVNTDVNGPVGTFGDSATDARHYTNYSLQRTSGDSSKTISSEMQTLVNMMNPMYFIGLKNSSIAKYWFIRDGAKATDTSCIVIVDLATSLENLLGSNHVNAWEYWEGGHAVNQDSDLLFSWLANEVLK